MSLLTTTGLVDWMRVATGGGEEGSGGEGSGSTEVVSKYVAKPQAAINAAAARA